MLAARSPGFSLGSSGGSTAAMTKEIPVALAAASKKSGGHARSSGAKYLRNLARMYTWRLRSEWGMNEYREHCASML
jgi:hypothetical protein